MTETALKARIDRCDERMISGWATRDPGGAEKLHIDILCGDSPLGACVADRFRQDLRDAGISDGCCGFEFPTPPFLPKCELSRIRVRVQETGDVVPLASPVDRAEMPGRSGGLWIDRADFAEQLAARQRRGEISDELAASITRFERDGYVIMEKVVSAEVIEAVNAEIERMWDSPPSGLKIEAFEPDGRMVLIPPVLRYREGTTKLLDLFAFSEVAREAIAVPKVIAFLRAVLEDKPKAFQSLAFWKGSQQAIHKDTAYVKIDSDPLHIVATWLALEDVHQGSGELEYYVGSHRVPHYLFGGAYKWMESHPEEHSQFLQSLHEDAAKRDLAKSSFLAKRGDLLIWHADLAHGGAPITDAGRTRKSLVTHFTAMRDEPYFRRHSRHSVLETESCAFVSHYADVTGTEDSSDSGVRNALSRAKRFVRRAFFRVWK